MTLGVNHLNATLSHPPGLSETFTRSFLSQEVQFLSEDTLISRYLFSPSLSQSFVLTLQVQVR